MLPSNSIFRFPTHLFGFWAPQPIELRIDRSLSQAKPAISQRAKRIHPNMEESFPRGGGGGGGNRLDSASAALRTPSAKEQKSSASSGGGTSTKRKAQQAQAQAGADKDDFLFGSRSTSTPGEGGAGKKKRRKSSAATGGDSSGASSMLPLGGGAVLQPTAFDSSNRGKDTPSKAALIELILYEAILTRRKLQRPGRIASASLHIC